MTLKDTRLAQDLTFPPSSTRRQGWTASAPERRRGWIYGQQSAEVEEEVVKDKAKTEPPEQPEPPARISRAELEEGLLAGAFAPVFLSGTMNPVARLPQQWNVMSHPVAIVDIGFAGFVLPVANLKMSDIIYPEIPNDELEFDQQCALDNPISPIPPMDHSDWSISARAIITAPIMNGDDPPSAISLTDIFSNKGADLISAGYAGDPAVTGDAPFFEMTVLSAGGVGTHDLVYVGGEEVNDMARFPIVVDLIFITKPNGSGWDLIVTRGSL